jgi:hypothetical protein
MAEWKVLCSETRPSHYIVQSFIADSTSRYYSYSLQSILTPWCLFLRAVLKCPLTSKAGYWLPLVLPFDCLLLPLWLELSLSLSLILRPTVSRPVWLGIKHPSGAYDQIFSTVDSYGLVLCGPPSLTRRRVCLLYMLLAHASAVFPRSESLRTRDHLLLSQSWDFPFRRLLRLAGSRWRYSTPPPHGRLCDSSCRNPCLKEYLAGPDTEHLASRFTFHRNDIVA